MTNDWEEVTGGCALNIGNYWGVALKYRLAAGCAIGNNWEG